MTDDKDYDGNVFQATSDDLLTQTRADIDGGDRCAPTNADLEPIVYYLSAIARVLLARELRATESHDSVRVWDMR